MPGLFITATGTDVGKTFVAAALIHALLAEGREVDAFKPVISGYETYAGSDAARLLEALGGSERDLDRISPLRFRAAVAPPSAAAQEGVILQFEDLLDRCAGRIEAAQKGLLLIEGAGGLMSPIAQGATNLDLILDLGVPAILVTGSYLGAISHALTALTVMDDEGIEISAIVISESGLGSPPTSELTNAFAEFCPDIPIVIAPRDAAWTAEALAALV